MALQVWLPLIGDFHNQGLAGNINFTTTGTVSDEPSGKIGSCKKFDTSNIIAPFNFTLGPELSACLWVKWTTFPGSSTNDWLLHLGSSSGYGNALLVLSNYHGTLLTVGVGGKYDFTYQHGFSTNEWHHIAFTWNGTIGKLYVDGDLKKSYTNLTGGTITSTNKISLGSNVVNSTTKLKGCLNDVRIYDHCLSAREVQEIAKGLMLHYPLSDTVAPANGKIYDCSGYGHHGNYSAVPPTVQSGSSRRSRSLFYKNVDNYFSSSIVMPAENKTISLSYWFKSANAGTGSYHQPFNINANNVELSVYNTSTGRPRFGLLLDGTRQLLDTGSGVQDGNWHHIAHTYDGSTMCTYIDGTLRGSKAASGSLVSGSKPISSGRYGNGTSYGNTNTSLSDIRLYATALNADQVKELYNNPVSVCKGGTLMCMEVVE